MHLPYYVSITLRNALHSRSLVLMFGILILGLPSVSAQILNWKSPIDGQFSEAINWLPNNAPDNQNESAKFNLFGDYAVDFDQPVGSQLKGLSATEGTIRFYSSTGDQTLSLDEAIEVEAATLELDRNNSPGDLHLVTATELSLSQGATIMSLEQSSLMSPSTTIGTGTNSEATELYLDDDAIAFLGNTSVSNTGSGSFDGLLTVFNDAIATVEDLDIASTGQSDRKGAVQIFSGGTISQPSGITTVGANSDEGLATLFVGFGGQFLGDELRVYQNGKIINNGSHVAIASSLLVDGAIYTESGSATRTIGAGASLTLTNQAEATFANSTLTLASGQSIIVHNSNLNSTPTLQLVNGSLSLSGTTSVVDAPIEVQPSGWIQVTTGSTVQFKQVIDNSGTIIIDSGAIAEFEGAYLGAGTVGEGVARFSDDVSPGMSPGIVNFGGNAEWTAGARHLVEIGGSLLGNWDQTVVANLATLDGELVIEPYDLGQGLYEPSIGDQFSIIQATEVEGTFASITLPTLANGSNWIVEYLLDEVVLTVVGEGDYNGDGFVNAADYTVWRDQLGSTGQYLAADGSGDGVIDLTDYYIWTSAYGNSSNASISTTIPEPSCWMLLVTSISLARFRPDCRK